MTERSMRRYGKGPKIKERLSTPSSGEAKEAAPQASVEQGTAGVTVNVNITQPGSARV